MTNKFDPYNDRWKDILNRTDAKDIKISEQEHERYVNELQYKQIKESLLRGDGKYTIADKIEFEKNHKINNEQLEREWFHNKYLSYLRNQSQKLYYDFKKSSNQKDFVRRLIDKGLRYAVSPLWWRAPKQKIGKGKWVKNEAHGGWHKQYKPTRSTRIKKWLHEADKEPEKVMPWMNKSGKSLNRELTDQEKKIAYAAKQKKKDNWWNWVLSQTNNFGRGFDDPRRGRPGQGGIVPGKKRL